MRKENSERAEAQVNHSRAHRRPSCIHGKDMERVSWWRMRGMWAESMMARIRQVCAATQALNK